ncbi:MAG TPA: ELWxxDGT repeat protein, partial [Humisphaera sp.]
MARHTVDGGPVVPRAGRRRPPACRTWAAAVEGLEPRRLLSAALDAAFPLLADINAVTESSSPRVWAELNGQVYFTAETPATGRELYSTDGTAGGTQLVADLLPGPNGSDPHDLAVVGSRIVFWAKDAGGVDRVHATDGTGAGTVRLSDTLAAAADRTIASSAGRAYFAASDGAAGLFSTDGVAPPEAVARAAAVNYPTAFGGSVLYVSSDAGGRASLRRADPGAGSTELVPASVVGPLVTTGNQVLFAAGGDPWRTDGTQAGTRSVVDLTWTDTSAAVTQAVTLANGTTLFRAGSDPKSYVFALAPGGGVTPLWTDSYYTADHLTAVGGTGYFTSGTSADGGTLVATDGTPGGTRVVRAFGYRNGYLPWTPTNLTQLGSQLVFACGDGTAGGELWVSDGTAAGTRRLADLDPGTANGNPSGLPEGDGTSASRPRLF